MKKVIVALLLIQLLFQEATSTHLETCDCNEIEVLVNTTIENAIARLEYKVTEQINKAIDKISKTEAATYTVLEKGLLDTKEQLFDVELNLTSIMERLVKPIQVQLDYHLPPLPGSSEYYPAESCNEIYKADSTVPSGYYWVKTSSGSPAKVYCKMDAGCGKWKGGWMRIGYIDMTNSSHQCPHGLRLTSTNWSPISKRVCDVTNESYYSCISIYFNIQGISYSHIYGRIKAYHYGFPRAFSPSTYNSIDQAYVYGVSLTHGQNPRKHIWTFAGAPDESTNNPHYKCPCINEHINHSSFNNIIPSFMGNDYFCDTSLNTLSSSHRKELYPSDPLWDGQGCASYNTCCSVANLCTNSPPWFIKHLSSSTTDDVEMRVCKPTTAGSTSIEIVELYVQ